MLGEVLEILDVKVARASWCAKQWQQPVRHAGPGPSPRRCSSSAASASCTPGTPSRKKTPAAPPELGSDRECPQWSPGSSAPSGMYVDRCLSACAGCPAGTVALGAGGADTDTQRAIPGSDLFRSQFKDSPRSEASTSLRSAATVRFMASLCGSVAVTSAVSDYLLRSNGQFVHVRPRPVSTSGLHLCRWPGVHGCPRPWQQVWQQSSPPEHLSKQRGST